MLPGGSGSCTSVCDMTLSDGGRGGAGKEAWNRAGLHLDPGASVGSDSSVVDDEKSRD